MNYIELREKAKFVEVTTAGRIESTPHGAN
jgi:hypothetical protein